ncbi:DUF3892 domain-containing protein [Bacillus tianshenii]|nr:DUF3892 domain-containing protein [Bacillus tianshenii]
MNDKNYEEIYNQYVQQSEQQAAQEAMNSNPNTNQETIIAVRKNNDGDLIAFKTDTGRVLDYPTAIAEAKAGKLAHIDVFHKYGRDILRSEPDGINSNNLDNLDVF